MRPCDFDKFHSFQTNILFKFRSSFYPQLHKSMSLFTFDMIKKTIETEHPTKGSREDSASKMRRNNEENPNGRKTSETDINPNRYTARQSSPKPTKPRPGPYYGYNQGNYN